MTLEYTPINGVLILKPKMFTDNRGYVFESYNKNSVESLGIDTVFVQDNEAFSRKGVLRGMHFQTKRVQAKLVRCIAGEVFDVVVDLREGSTTFLKWFGTTLSQKNKAQMYIPEGVAHGFLTLSEEAVFSYKCSDFYDASGEGGFRWNDPVFSINWPLDGEPITSEKDAGWPDYNPDDFSFSYNAHR